MGKQQQQPHAVMVPLPTPGHINPMLKLAKLLHSRGFFVTFVLTDYTRHCLLKTGGQDPLLRDARDGFRFETVSDGLPLSGREVLRQLEELGVSLRTKFPIHFRKLLVKLSNGGSGSSNGSSSSSPVNIPPVTCVVAGFMSHALRVAEELGIRTILFWTASACGFMGTLQIDELVKRGYIPLKDERYLDNGYLETKLDWVPGMKGIRLKDLTRFIRTTKANDLSLRLEKEEAEIGYRAWGVVVNTFDELEADVVSALKRMFPRLYTVGSLALLAEQIAPSSPSKSIELNLWAEDTRCLQWLDRQAPASVVYVNFGSITVLTEAQLMEFAWGLARSNHPFLWIVRPDLVSGGSSPIPSADFIEEAKGRGFLASWCPQERVLSHPSVGGFLTHAGWNSALESICNGVPMLCWPFFAEQPTNCRYICGEWGVGMEIEADVRRGQVEALVRELMGGEKGKAVRRNAGAWKKRAAAAVSAGVKNGSSLGHMDALVRDLKCPLNLK